MALDPQAKVIFDAMESNDFSISVDMSPQELREQSQGTMGGPPEPEMASVEDRTIPGPGGELPIRIYKPVESDEALAGVVFFHGGGWVLGSLETHDSQVRSLAAQTGAIFVAVDYRLAPEDPYPAAPNDCYAATCWVGDNAVDLGIDPNRLAVAGDSAGGNLSAVVSQMVRDKGGPNLCFQLLIYPCTDVDTSAWGSAKENAEGPLLKTEMMEYFYQHYLGTKVSDDPYAAPIKAKDLSNLPPALVVTAELDPLRDEGEAYAKKLAEAGVEARAIRYDGMFHGFFGFTDFLDKAKEAQKEAAAMLKAALILKV